MKYHSATFVFTNIQNIACMKGGTIYNVAAKTLMKFNTKTLIVIYQKL